MYEFIVNPASKSGRGLKIWSKIEAALQLANAEYRLHYTTKENNATVIAAELTADEEKHTLVALGGDGTLNETVNGIRDFSNVTLFYIPTGSSNDFARSIELESDCLKAVQHLLHPGYFKQLDLGEITLEDGTVRRFAVSCGMGFDAAVCEEAMSSSIKDTLNRMGLGKLTYAGIALKQIIKGKKNVVSLTIPEMRFKKTYKTTFLTAIQNCPYEGGGLKLCPDACPSDRKLNACLVNGLPKPFIACMLPTAYFGAHTHFPGIHLYEGTSFRLHSEQPAAVHTDGEYLGMHTDLTVKVLPHTLKLLT